MNDIENISVDFEVKNKVPKNIKLCVSPLFISFNSKPIQAAISSQAEKVVKKIVKGDTICDTGGLLSRFLILDTTLVKSTSGGVKFNGYHDGGQYITVRNNIKWDKGLYRVRLFKSGYTEGKPISADSMKRGVTYNINEYEHSWVTMTFEDLRSHKKWTIGSVAIPGKTIKMINNNWLFLEIYGTAINYGEKESQLPPPALHYTDIPTIKVVYKNFQINNKVANPKTVIINTGENLQHKMGRAVWNKETVEVECEIGYKE